MFEVVVPEVGESITEGILVEWSAQNGVFVQKDDELFVLETDKVTLSVNSEEQGRLEVIVEAGSTVQMGQTVARIDPDAAPDADGPGEKDGAPRKEPEMGHAGEPEGTAPADVADRATEGVAAGVIHREEGPPQEIPAGHPQARAKLETRAKSEGRAKSEAETGLSPAVRRMVEEHGLDPVRIRATGKNGRLTKEDVVRHLEEAPSKAPSTVPSTVPSTAPPTAPSPTGLAKTASEKAGTPAAAAPVGGAPGEPRKRQTRVPMSALRQRIAQRLVEAQQTAAILTTFNEVDMHRVMDWRSRHREAFEKEHGVRLGYMSFFVKAAVEALKTVPEVGAQIQGDEMVYNHVYDIGVAIGTEHGLVVPVIRDADRLHFAGIERSIEELAAKAQARTLTLAEITGGIFTISNGGIYGNMMSTPILNPPQSGILGMHAIKKRPVAVDDQIVIRPMMYVALSYDHRLVDGREAVTFLKRVKDCIENPERMLLEI